MLGKGNKPREIPLSVSAEQTLGRYLRYVGDKYSGGFEKLFPRSYSTYWRRLQMLGVKAGAKVSPHCVHVSMPHEISDLPYVVSLIEEFNSKNYA